ncbi:MAG: DUF2191 domain-containing protein [Bacteroidetes bacterium 4484_249]|nr:MAG: DUF2191 domain-containing protein [Bacteroidetes bacterium 4484_249]
MNTTIEIDENLLKEALRFVDVKNENELVNIALKELIKNLSHKNISDLKGKIKFADGYNYKELRKGTVQ